VREAPPKEKESGRKVRSAPVGALTHEKRNAALRNNPFLAGRADADYILENIYPELSEFIIPLLGEDFEPEQCIYNCSD